jgi:hypothetical protein
LDDLHRLLKIAKLLEPRLRKASRPIVLIHNSLKESGFERLFSEGVILSEAKHLLFARAESKADLNCVGMGNPAGVRRDFKALEQRRMQAARLLEKGYSQSEVARRVGAHRHAVKRTDKCVHQI